jgi:hypothetical protein
MIQDERFILDEEDEPKEDLPVDIDIKSVPVQQPIRNPGWTSVADICN